MSESESKIVYQWFCKQWHKLLPHFHSAAPDASSSTSSTLEVGTTNAEQMFDHAYAMQQLLIARLFHLGGGQC